MPSLYDQLADIATLSVAWHRVRASGIRSKNATTKQSIQAFDANSEARLELLASGLSDGSFTFGKAKAVLISRDGKSPRPLLVPEIPARIVQRALLDVLQAQGRVREYVAHPCSFGGLPKRPEERIADPRRRALTRACREIYDGASFFARSDIPGFFTRVLREDVLERISRLLPDDSLTEILDEATDVEIGNIDQVRHHLQYFPNGVVGVAQGCCLSPLFGNIYLREFDDQMNTGDGIVTLRYIDDFVILARSQKQSHKAFKRAKAILKGLELDAYPLSVGMGKSGEGRIAKGFDFLGCRVTPSRIEPTKASRNAFLDRVRTELKASARVLRKGISSPREEHALSFVGTLSRVSRMVRGWTEQYEFCNETNAFSGLDRKLDRMLRRYMMSFFKNYSGGRAEATARRRILGIWLAADCERDPILPLKRVAEGVAREGDAE